MSEHNSSNAIDYPVWPPKYSVRFSRKAKRAIIYVREASAVEIALPQAMAVRMQHEGLTAFIENLLLRHQDWITRQLARQLSLQLRGQTDGHNQPCSSQPAPVNAVPESFVLPSTGEHIAVHWNNQSTRNAYCLLPPEDEHPARLMLSTKHLEGAKAAIVLLRTWVKDYALRVFEPQIRNLAAKEGFAVRTVKTRLQRTRLGSCTRQGVISLNAAMLFFPPDLVRHLMFHELCHLKEMNHGPGFWKLLLSLDEQCLKNDKALKRAMRSVPGWLFSKLEN